MLQEIFGRTCRGSRPGHLRAPRLIWSPSRPFSELDTLCGAAPVPKNGWRWVDNAQYKLTQKGQHRGPGPIDLLICATAVHHGLTVLHVDSDFATVADVLPEVRHRDIRT